MSKKLLVLLTVTAVGAGLTFETALRQAGGPVAKPVRPFVPPVTATPTVSPAPSPPVFNLRAQSFTDPASLWVVVNKQRALPLDYTPRDLVVPAARLQFAASLDQMHLRTEAATALAQMLSAADKAGLPMMLTSGYRSGSYQAALYSRNVRTYGLAATDRAVARAGHSEHQTGLAADVSRVDGRCILETCFGETPEGRWLVVQAASYGFIIRYPQEKEAVTGYKYEPWHLRYVGRDLAIYLGSTGEVLDDGDR